MLRWRFPAVQTQLRSFLSRLISQAKIDNYRLDGREENDDANTAPQPTPPLIPPALLSQLNALVSDVAMRRELQTHGINLILSDFYSTVPSMKELDNSFEHAERSPYLQTGIFDQARMLDVLTQLAPYAQEINFPVAGDPKTAAGFFWDNGQFGYSDPSAYYAFIRARKPRRILEIGAGFSTLIANAAVEANGYGEIHCVEPYPRPFLGDIPHVRNLIRRPIQYLDAGWVNDLLDDGDILFIDSTHTVKIGSDCLHLYLRILPALKKKLLVHVHDVFLPEGMPLDWARDHHIYWTEQYLLLAYLLDNPKVQVLFGSRYHEIYNMTLLSRLTPEFILPGGSSFWFDRTP